MGHVAGSFDDGVAWSDIALRIKPQSASRVQVPPGPHRSSVTSNLPSRGRMEVSSPKSLPSTHVHGQESRHLMSDHCRASEYSVPLCPPDQLSRRVVTPMEFGAPVRTTLEPLFSSTVLDQLWMLHKLGLRLNQFFVWSSYSPLLTVDLRANRANRNVSGKRRGVWRASAMCILHESNRLSR